MLSATDLIEAAIHAPDQRSPRVDRPAGDAQLFAKIGRKQAMRQQRNFRFMGLQPHEVAAPRRKSLKVFHDHVGRAFVLHIEANFPDEVSICHGEQAQIAAVLQATREHRTGKFGVDGTDPRPNWRDDRAGWLP